MAYRPPSIPAFRDLDEARVWFEEEFRSIAEAMTETTAIDLRPVYAEPIRPREGMIVYSDGTQWDPGSGAGAYVYQGGAWNFMSHVTPPDLSVFMTKAANLSDVASAATSRSNIVAATKAQTEYISGMIKTAANQDYRLIEDIPWGATITKFIGKMASGTLTAALKINTTAITGGSINATSTQSSSAPSAANVLVATDELVMTVSSISSPVDFSFTVHYTRTLS